jgi:hypothetical protein
VTRPTVPPTLTAEQIDDLRRDVEAGKRRKVFLLTDSAGLPAGGTGDVTRVGQPETDGSDFIGVRIGGDELFFAPAELGLGAGRGKAKAAPSTAPSRPAAPGPADAAAYAKATAERTAKTTTAKAPAKSTTSAPGKSLAPTKAAAPAKAKGATPATTGAPAKGATPATTGAPARATAPAETAAPARAATAKAVRGGRKPPRLPAIAITIRSTDGGWTVEAQRGGKAALKATPVRAGTVQEIADALDESVVTAMVREVLDARRAVAESEAEELREALARAEAVLAEYDAGH